MGDVTRSTIADIARPGGAAMAVLLLGLLAACQTDGAPGRRSASAIAGPTVPAPPDATRPMAPAVAAANAAFRFDQILGVPTVKQDTLAHALADDARTRNIRLVRRSDPSAPYRVLGYLSAVGGDAGVSVTYVWDIVDADNKRVHRVTGVETAGTADADPWSGVDNKTLEAIAARTIEDIYAWINRLPSTGAAAVPAAPVRAI